MASGTSLQIDGMTCGACVGRVDKALRSVAGVRTAAVNLTTGIARVEGEPDAEQLIQAVDRSGYTAHILADTSAATLRQIDQRSEEHTDRVRQRLVLGVLFGVPLMLLDLAHMLLHIHAERAMLVIAVVEALLATAVMATAGRPYFSGGWRALRHGSANMDVLVAIGAGTAYVYSLVLTIFFLLQIEQGALSIHRVPLEFHAAVAIVVLVTVGKYLEARAKKRAASAIAGLAKMSSPTASRLRDDGSIENIPAEQIKVGDRLQVLAHQQLPVDGTLIGGAGALDLSVITGESVPQEISEISQKAPGEDGHVFPGGATLSDGRIVIRATSTAATSTVARILDLVNASQASKTHIQGMADRIASIFVPIILGLAAINFAAWIIVPWARHGMLSTQDWTTALLTTIATVVIACPCAMGLATPTAITVALGRAARLGILFTNAAALESGNLIQTVLFDKTGTLTEGTLAVSDVKATKESGMSEDRLLALAASIEQFSDHPLARSVVGRATAGGLNLLEPTRFNSAPGGGVRATFEDGHEYAAGSAAFISSLGIGATAEAVSTLGKEGASVIVLADAGEKKVLGVVSLIDTLRADTASTLALLRARGVQVGVISGDNEISVRAALRDLPVDFLRANVKPDQKAAAIEEFKSASRRDFARGRGVAFVGDGVNDAPALAAADLGIAMASGTDLAKSAGDVLLLSNRLESIPALLELSRRTLRIIRQNLFWAFAYNVAAIPLAMLGILSPGIAAGAMVLSSLTVVFNALRLNRVKL